MCMYTAGPDANPSCKQAKPIADCEIMMEAEQLIFNTTIDLGLKFTVLSPMVQNDTIEFAFPGFVAHLLPDQTEINVSSVEANLADPGMLDVRVWDIPAYKPYNESDTDTGKPGCYALKYEDTS